MLNEPAKEDDDRNPAEDLDEPRRQTGDVGKNRRHIPAVSLACLQLSRDMPDHQPKQQIRTA